MKKFLTAVILYTLYFILYTSSLAFSEPEIINPENGLFCVDLNIEYRTGSTEIITPTPSISPMPTPSVSQQTGVRTFEGRFRLDKGDFPDLKPMVEIFSNALEKLLPASLKENLSIEEKPLKTRVKHFIGGKFEAGVPTPTSMPEKIPETELSQPGWFTKLLGLTKIICGLWNVCPPPKSLTIKINQPDIQTLSSSISKNTACSTGQNAPGEAINDIAAINEEFKTQASFTRTTQTNGQITRTETAQLQDKTRGQFVGAETLNKQYPFLNSFLPAELVAEENYALKNNADYWISGPYQIKNEEVLNYQNLNAVRAFCLQQCALLPSGTDISLIYGFCPSCKPDDYPLSKINLPVPPQSCSADKPYEIIPSCTICQNILFCYGNNYRLCPADPQIPPPALGSRNEYWWFAPDTFPLGLVLYNGELFPVPPGGVYVCDSNVYGCANEKCH